MDEGEARRVQPKVALVTGAAWGMGGAIAARLAQAGADMAVADRRDTLSQDTARAVTALGRRTVALSVEVTDTAQVAQVGPDAPGCSGTMVDR
jgi:NAD(P)-dependent dehydrogenase (short-subunit alcohol dehydrogenase family)